MHSRIDFGHSAVVFFIADSANPELFPLDCCSAVVRLLRGTLHAIWKKTPKKLSFPLHSIEFFIYSQTCVYGVVYGLHLLLLNIYFLKNGMASWLMVLT